MERGNGGNGKSGGPAHANEWGQRISACEKGRADDAISACDKGRVERLATTIEQEVLQHKTRLDNMMSKGGKCEDAQLLQLPVNATNAAIFFKRSRSWFPKKLLRVSSDVLI